MDRRPQLPVSVVLLSGNMKPPGPFSHESHKLWFYIVHVGWRWTPVISLLLVLCYGTLSLESHNLWFYLGGIVLLILALCSTRVGCCCLCGEGRATTIAASVSKPCVARGEVLVFVTADMTPEVASKIAQASNTISIVTLPNLHSWSSKSAHL